MRQFQYRYFYPDIMSQFLSKRENQVVWKGRYSGILRCLSSSSVNPEIEFQITSDGCISVLDATLVRQPQRDQFAWQAQECTLDRAIDKVPITYTIERNRANTVAPERFLVDAIRQANQSFIREYGLPLLKQRDLFKHIQHKVHRFRAVGEDGPLALASDTNKFVIEWIEPSSLKFILSTEIPKRNTLKLLEQFLRDEKNFGNASEITAPLFGLNDLRNFHSHLTPDDQREERYFKSIGVNRGAPIIHQGAEMIDLAAIALSNLIGN